MWEVIGRILLGILSGFLFGLIPLVIGFLLGKNGGGVVGLFLCTICGGFFAFLNKSIVLSLIIAIVVVLFIVTDKSKPTNISKQQNKNAPSEDDGKKAGSEPSDNEKASVQDTDGVQTTSE